MRPINALLAMALFLPFTALAEPSLPQIEAHTVAAPASAWQLLVDTLRGLHPLAGDLQVTVTDSDGHPLAGASVLAGQSAGKPFAGNQTLTDASGVATFTDPSLRGQAVTVTASLNGYATASLLDNKDNSVRIALARNPDERGVGFLRGNLNGIPKLGGGTLELGFFIPAATPESMLNFNIDSFVSSYKVKVNVYGDRDIPGNVVLPTQTKFYTVVPISISKPDFIMPLPTSMNAHMYGLAGGISIQQAVKVVQSKDYLELLNIVSLTNVGWTRDRVQVHGNENFDINASHTVVPGQVTAQLSGLAGSKLDAVAVSLVDPSGDKGDFVAMDIKALKSENMQNGGGAMRLGQVRARSRAADNFYVFTALFDKTQIQHSNSRWVVGSVQPVAHRSVVPFTHFLSPIKPIGVSSDNREFHFSSPANGSLAPDMMIISLVSEKDNAETMGKTRTVLWSAIANGATDHITLPNLGRAVLPAPDTGKGEKFHWEVTGLRTGASREEGLNLQASLKGLQDVSTLSQSF
ncbi:MAG: Ig-like domain-containing protein [Bdellovibrionota bacterium]